MKEKNLLASVALFSELYNSESYKSVFDILAEFIKSSLLQDKRFNFSSTELKTLLEKTYGFRIPEPVLRTTLNNKLKDVIKKKGGVYFFDHTLLSEPVEIQDDFNVINNSHNQLLADLEKYIEQKSNVLLSDADKAEVFDNFNHFLLDNGYSDKYSDLISAYIITNQHVSQFHNSLNTIREGLIMYQGIIYTSDINELGKWNTDLVLYLNTEQLFSALGYNGVLFQEIFNDFYKLVNEINLSSPNQNKGRRIELRYFEETQNEVDNYFNTAESIKRGNTKLDPTKSAMKMIVDSSSSVSDIKATKVKFEIELKRLGIHLQEFNQSWEVTSKYNVEDQGVLEELQKRSQEQHRNFDESLCIQYFRIFTKINYYRRGESDKVIEKIGHLFITENNFAKYLAHNNAVKFADTDIPFAKDIDYITTKFWFRLKKGFSDKQSLPKSFDVVTKAKIILAAHLKTSVSEGYHKLVEDVKSGKLSQEEAIERTYEFRQKSMRPEDITLENVDNTLDFLHEETFFEDLFREKQRKDELLTETQQRLLELEQEIKNRDEAKAQELVLIRSKEVAKMKAEYAVIQWKKHTTSNNRDLFYMLGAYFPEALMVFFALTAKGIHPIDTYLAALGSKQIYFYIVLSLLFGLAVFLRSHIYNKPRIVNGFKWLGKLLKLSYKQYKKAYQEQMENSYAVKDA
jgi:hypothetical protein